MALEWCSGGCLRDALLGGHFAAAEKAMEAGLQLTSALRALHEAGLVHGDLCGDWYAKFCTLSSVSAHAATD